MQEKRRLRFQNDYRINTGSFLRHGADGLFAKAAFVGHRRQNRGAAVLHADVDCLPRSAYVNEMLSHTGRAFLFLRMLYSWKAQRVRGLAFWNIPLFPKQKRPKRAFPASERKTVVKHGVNVVPVPGPDIRNKRKALFLPWMFEKKPVFYRLLTKYFENHGKGY